MYEMIKYRDLVSEMWRQNSLSSTTCLSGQGLSKRDFLPLLLSHKHVATECALCMITWMHTISGQIMSMSFWVGYLQGKSVWSSLVTSKCSLGCLPHPKERWLRFTWASRFSDVQKLGRALATSYWGDGRVAQWLHVGKILTKGELRRGSLLGRGEKKRDYMATPCLLKIYKFCCYLFIKLLLTSL